MTRSVRTICPYCGVGCGVIATVDDDTGRVTVKGDPAHPANYGRLCSKGAALGDTLGLKGRLLRPQIRGEVVSLEAALQAVADGFNEVIAKHGPNSVAFYVSGQLLTEDYYVANKLMKGFIGAANIDTNSRLCMASSVAGHKRAFGFDSVPGCYEDLEQADLVVLVGSNMAWCHPVLYQRVMAARAENPAHRLVVIDPRRTDSCEGADLHLPVKPGSDVALFNGLLSYLDAAGCCDQGFVRDFTDQAKEALEAARESVPDIATAAQICGLAEEDLQRFYSWFAATEKVVTLFAEGVNQSSAGTDKVNAIINAHLFTGRIAKPGAGPFSLTGQSNAMGGREVGGLANQLAGHMVLEKAAHRKIVEQFWKCGPLPAKPGLTAVDMFNALHDGRIKAIWIMCTNPAVSLPNASHVREALAKCDLVVVSDVLEKTDTTAYADILLPAAPWGEKSGTVTNSERRISRMRAFLAPAGDAKPDWWLIKEVARRMGHEQAFAFESAAAVFREHAALSGFENEGQRDFDISALAELSDHAYDELQPVQWPVTRKAPLGTARLFTEGRFFTPSGKAQFQPLTPRPPRNPTSKEYPFILNTGRIRDQWHTMTRTARAPQLNTHIPEPVVSLHPLDAEELGVKDHHLVEIKSRWGATIMRAQLTDSQRRQEVFAPMHWTDTHAKYGRIGTLVNPVVDPISHQPESKHTPVAIRPIAVKWYGFLLSRRDLDLSPFDYWVRAETQYCVQVELAGFEPWQDWPVRAREILCTAEKKREWIEYSDPKLQVHRFARLANGRLDSCLFIAPQPLTQPRDWLTSLFGLARLDRATRSALLAGKPLSQANDKGAIVCSCFQIGEKQIEKAILNDGAGSVEAIGELLKAGTNCGSCKPEISRLIAAAKSG